MSRVPATITVAYDFTFPDGTETSYAVELDGTTLSLLPGRADAPPDWTRLEHHQCSHCPLSAVSHPYCPVAVNLAPVVEFFKDKASFQEATVRVRTAERTYLRTVPLQQGIFGIFGLIMATSACPYMDFLKPMARFHLPFSTVEETIVRSVSMYLLRQYFVAKHGGQPDLELERLEAHYDNIRKVNDGIFQRIKAVAEKDADLNALIVLHSFGSIMTMAMSRDLSRIEPLFFRAG